MRVVEPVNGLSVGGVFSGIGGLELGFGQAGFESRFLCEIDPDAQMVLEEHFPGTNIFADVNRLGKLPEVSVLAAGFPCQDLSAVGTRLGISGARSSLIHKLLDLVAAAGTAAPPWIVLENVPFMLQLKKGSAIADITNRLAELDYKWAYRVVDSRAFGLPQRRRRVILVAARDDNDPRSVLFADQATLAEHPDQPRLARGFYWTEGNRGVGWAIDAIPTLKGGSALSIPSPPAIWTRDDKIGLPAIKDAERLQGFQADWTIPTEAGNERRRRRRWRQIGNAVSVPVAAWVAQRIANPGDFDEALLRPLPADGAWPTAACGDSEQSFKVAVSEYPIASPRRSLHEFLEHDLTPISVRAARGFYTRIAKSCLRLEPGFLEAVAEAAGIDRRLARRVRPSIEATSIVPEVKAA